MIYLTEEGEAVSTTDIPNRMATRHFATLDMKAYDFAYPPLIFLDRFRDNVATVSVGRVSVDIPADWKILIYDNEVGYIDAMSLREVVAGDAFSFHPIRSIIAEALPFSVSISSQKADWEIPRLTSSSYLVVPVGERRAIVVGKGLWKQCELADII